MRKIVYVILALVALFYLMIAISQAEVYVIEYESYRWNPCSKEGSCLAISCPLDGCFVQGSVTICKTQECVTGILDKSGEDHLKGIWRIDYENKISEKMVYKKKYKLEATKPSSGTILYGTTITPYLYEQNNDGGKK